MRAVQVSRAGRPARNSRTGDPGPRSRSRAGARRGQRHLPQRRADEGGPLAGDRLPACSGPRDRGRGGRDWRRRRRLGERRPRRSRLARRTLRPVRVVPARGLSHLSHLPPHFGDLIRRRLRGLRRRSGSGARPDPGGPVRGRSRAAHGRGSDDLHGAAPQRRAAGRPRCGPRRGRPRASGRPVRREDGLRHGRHRARGRQGGVRAASSARASTSTARKRTPRRS